VGHAVRVAASARPCDAFSEIRPAATMIEAGLADPRMKIEIEAVVGSG